MELREDLDIGIVAIRLSGLGSADLSADSCARLGDGRRLGAQYEGSLVQICVKINGQLGRRKEENTKWVMFDVFNINL